MNETTELFCALVFYDFNIRELHWKVKGLDFGTKHELMDEYHSKFDSMIDDLGEILMMTGNVNIPSLSKVITIIGDSDEEFIPIDGERYYDVAKLLTLCEKMFNHLISIYESVIQNGNLPGDVVNTLQEHQYWLRKEAQYKLKSSLTQ